jgi:hypothetical protein
MYFFFAILDQMDRSWVHGRLFSCEHIDGVKEFMNFIQGKLSEDEQILCPCGRCLNQKYLSQALVDRHILLNGMDSSYTRWIHHGERLDIDVIKYPDDVHDNDDGFIHEKEGVTEDYSADTLEAVLGDLQNVAEQARQDDGNEGGQDQDGNVESHHKDSCFEAVMKEAKCQLYHGCSKFSRFSFVVKLLHMKSLYRISNSIFAAIVKLWLKHSRNAIHSPNHIMKQRIF